jgi:zinc protease
MFVNWLLRNNWLMDARLIRKSALRKFSQFLLTCVLVLGMALAALAQRAVDVVPKREKLLNGLPLIVLERPGSGSVALHLVIKSGATFDLVGKAGLADLTAQMLTTSPGGWPDGRLEQELQELKARLEVTAGWDSVEIRLLGNNANFEMLMDILSRLATLPKFDEPDFVNLKNNRTKALPQPRDLASNQLIDDAFFTALYRTHPYGHNLIGTPDSVNRINRGDTADFYERLFVANNAALIVVGDVAFDRILPVMRRAMGGWRKGAVPPYTFSPPSPVEGINVQLLNRDDDKVAIRLGNFAIKRSDSSYLTLRLVTEILNQQLPRQFPESGATLATRKLTAPFVVQATATTASAASTVTALRETLQKFPDAITAQDLQAARDRLIAAYQENIETNTELAARWAEIENYNLGAVYIKMFADQVNRISLDDARRVARQYLAADNLLVLVAGRKNELAESLKAVGTVTDYRPPAPPVVKPPKTVVVKPVTKPSAVNPNKPADPNNGGNPNSSAPASAPASNKDKPDSKDKTEKIAPSDKTAPTEKSAPAAKSDNADKKDADNPK